VSNYGARQQQQSSLMILDKWKRYWWNKALGIVDSSGSRYDHPNIGINDLISSNKKSSNNEKYAQKINDMYQYECPLPPRNYKQIWLEIGFGSGLNLLANAKQHPDILFLGCEIHQPGVGTILQNIEKELNASETPTSSSSSSPYQNIRILPGDGIKLLSHFPANYLDAILITFPDPWPNENEHDWRVIQSGILKEMHRVIASGKVYVATDAECFNDWARSIFIKDTPHWKEATPTPDRSSWLPVVSYYEQKGLDEGRKTMLQCWEKIE